ncbi:site-specific DNA-methyltransferase [Sphingobacterium sp. MYb388]|uniref:site-specific DNA-methyltransferase n=1 Tax=Sphingobacterium sp. MYb388 TaxID=2745437 RepID=UPI0030A8C730
MNNYNKLQEVLKEIFEMDKADLDFGIYRIMNQKRGQVMDFIDRHLPQDIKSILALTQSKDGVSIQAELDKMGAALDAAGVARETAPNYIALKSQLENAIDTNALEQEVFSHLANFFKRYYKDGDFISLRRYKKDVYAIPYEGEEVKLHWANHDQYYIKTSEYLKNYTFNLKNGKKVHFQLKEASTEQNNNKTQGDAERRFAIYEEEPVEVIDGALYINFTYEQHKKTVKQADLATKAFEVIQNNIPAEFALAFDKAPTEKNKSRTLVEKHLNDFISRNSFDYFIHKDLGGFLSRELDFYIKNEVLFIDDINTENPAHFTAQLSKIKALKTVASKIIAFLAQIEDFQKKLWLKKKFVIATNYCITIDRIPEKYYSEIVANQAQLDEWKVLFDVTIPSSEGEALETLGNEPYLVLDTKHFSEEFKDKLLAEFDDLDEETNGVLINSENFQALNVMQEKYQEKISAEIIDPPYNTGGDGFIYKDSFKSSSWLSFMKERLELGKYLLNDSGNISINIDENEDVNLSKLVNIVFGDENNLGKITWDKRNPKGDAKGIATQHEYIQIANKNFNISKSIENFLVKDKNNAEELLKKAASIVKKHKGVTEEAKKEYKQFVKQHGLLSGGERAYNTLDDDGEPFQAVSMSWPNKEKAPEDYFIPLIHPITKKDCPIPNKGWRYPSVSMKNLLDKNLIVFGKDESTQPRRKYLLRDNLTENLSSLYYLGGSDDKLFKDLGIEFPNPKPLIETKYLIESLTKHQDNPIILDYFAGSGTLGHSILQLNKKSTAKKYKYILVDMGSYFDSTLKYRIKRVTYTDNWKDGKPQDKAGISQIFKYHVLESYEDALNNLVLKQPEGLLNFSEAGQEEYLLNYMLDVEIQDHLFNIQLFKNPFNYQLKVTENNELVPTNVDLVETFNYLIGMYVSRVQRIKDIKVVEGKTREGEKTLIIWRNTETTSHDEVATVFRKLYDGVRSSEFGQIYINGDHHFENMRTGDDVFKVKSIEEAFFKQMFNISEL